MVRKSKLLTVLPLALLIAFTSCKKDEENVVTVMEECGIPSPPPMMNGVSFEGPVNEIFANEFDPMLDVNANWVTFMPFGFTFEDDPELTYNISWQWWGEKSEGVIKCTEMAHDKGLKVMIKPQVWIMNGAFTGDFDLPDDSSWQVFEQRYYNFIMEFVHIADSLNAEAFCIGTEFKNFWQERPEFWGNLIDSVRANYSGIVTYAGNWDSYVNFPHWNKLDLIGIDAYFPLSPSQSPTVDELLTGWEPWFLNIKAQSELHNKPVIFCEYGYRSMDFTANQPWDSGTNNPVNMAAQDSCYIALYRRFWGEEWFRGGFLWKWHDDHPN